MGNRQVRSMRNRFTTIFLLALLALAALADPVTLATLMADRKAHDGKIVTVTGTVKGYFEKDDYSSCLLFEQGKACSLYLTGKAGLANEQKVTVTGTFSLEKKLNNHIFSNVVEVNEVTKR